MHRMLLVFIVLLPSLVVAQTEAIEDNWAALKFLEGKWVDEKPGVSKVKQEYEFILFVFRQFHSEGFVNQYILDKKDSEMNELTFISEQIENAPEGTK